MSDPLVNETFTCGAECGRTLPAKGYGGSGYGQIGTGPKFCYDCMAKYDADSMKEEKRMSLYITAGPNNNPPAEVVNWPGTLRLPVIKQKTSEHNIANWRIDAWFTGPDGAKWHGVAFGDSQLLRCRRLKRQRKKLTPLPESSYLKPYNYS